MKSIFRKLGPIVLGLLLAVAALAQQGSGIQGGGGGAAPVTGNFTLIWNSGFTVNQNQIINFSTLGNLTTLRFTADVTGTSNGIGFTNNGTNGIPVAQRPSVDVTVYGLACTDNAVAIACCAVIHASTGGIDLTPATTISERCTGSWTGSGTKGMQVGASRVNQVTYSSI